MLPIKVVYLAMPGGYGSWGQLIWVPLGASSSGDVPGPCQSPERLWSLVCGVFLVCAESIPGREILGMVCANDPISLQNASFPVFL